MQYSTVNFGDSYQSSINFYFFPNNIGSFFDLSYNISYQRVERKKLCEGKSCSIILPTRGLCEGSFVRVRVVL